MIAEGTHRTLPPVPDSPAMMTLPAWQLKESRSLWVNLPAPIHADAPLSMEQVDQAYGYILYRTKLEGKRRRL